MIVNDDRGKHSEYTVIDSVIHRWSEMHQLPLMKKYKDAEVRSFDFTDQSGNRYQLWIDPPNEKGLIEIHAWDYRKRRKNVITTTARFLESLEIVYREIQSS
jgi:hypothetical protein